MCVGTEIAFSAEGLVVDSTLPEWDFGDSTAGTPNHTIGNPVRHRYLLPSTYQVKVMVATASGPVQRTQQIRVNALPALRLIPRGDTALCYGESLTLHASPQPGGTVYRWQDGSTNPTLTVQQPGQYMLEIRNAAGCTERDSIFVRDQACMLPNIITPNGDALNQTFVLAGLNAVEWSIRIFNRWGTQVFHQAQYDNSWSADGQVAGLYYYLLTNSQTGVQRKGWVEVVK
ncbi:gliding motility-associated C-terminal domain-containing protein [Hymenobacter sp. BRD67]|uniref:T9SS type B sorting domain-containing protein n=1 Tax=Hymenobacter sp. BRD67 TaxID=2675877 RepID=UPI001565B54C|nr:gliding motility-associated C-terminal domain-containing protein [Hymenobacter sp. BRD67]QKG52772.1 gliding motility-associated C-terminal domain-containing protein [Hymenobacter sp. BRD67]